MIFLETSVLVAAWQDNHVQHHPSFALVTSLSPEGASTSIHCVTELFSVMTHLPPRQRVSPVEAWKLVQQTQNLLSVIALDAGETLDVLRVYMERGLGGGMVYDAIIMSAARKVEARAIYTLNKRHFDLVAPDMAPRILLP